MTLLEEAERSTQSRDIAFFLDRSINAVRRKCRLLGLTPDAGMFRRHHQINDTAFGVWSEELAYWMGFIAADGSLRSSTTKKISGIAFQLSERDADHLRRLQALLQSEHPVSVKGGRLPAVTAWS